VGNYYCGEAGGGGGARRYGRNQGPIAYEPGTIALNSGGPPRLDSIITGSYAKGPRLTPAAYRAS